MPNELRFGPSEGVSIARAGLGAVVLRVSLLGPMRATTVLGADVLPKSKKGRAILSLLTLADGGAVSRSALAAMLWHRVEPNQALDSLRQELHAFRVRFEALPEGTLCIDRARVRLDPERCWIDALAVREYAEDGRAESGNAIDLCRGDLLADLSGLGPGFEAWRQGEADRQRAAVLELVEREVDRLAMAGSVTADLPRLARRLVALAPESERASRLLMHALLQAGDRVGTIAEYDRMEKVLAAHHGLVPSEEVRALVSMARVTRSSQPPPSPPPSPAVVPDTTSSADIPHAHRRGARWRLRVLVAPFAALGSLHDPTLPAILAQDVAAALARFRWFDVIVPMGEPIGSRPDTTSAGRPGIWAQGFRWRREAPDYVLDATVVQRHESVRVLTRLLHIENDVAAVVWDSEIDLPEDQLAEFSTRVTGRIVARVDPQILFIEGARLEASGERPSSATEMVLRAIPMMYRFDRAEFDAAGVLLAKALAVDPNCAKAASWRAYWLLFMFGQGWAESPRALMEEAERLCLQALRIDPANAEAMGIYAHLRAFVHKDLDGALEFFEKAIHLNPNLAMVWALSAPVQCYVGKPDEALERLDRYRDLAPNDPYFSMFETMYTIAHLMRRDYGQAIATGLRGVRNNPEFTNGYKPLLAALGHAGKRVQANRILAALLRREPDFSIAKFREVYPLKRARDRNHYISGLRKAGVPEGSLPASCGLQSKKGSEK